MRQSRMSGLLSSVALTACAVVVCGCAEWQAPRIDPSGERLFLPSTPDAPPNLPVAATYPPGPQPVAVAPVAAPVVAAPVVAPAVAPVAPGRPLRGDELAVQLMPRRTVAPVGSQVVLLAGVRGGDGYLRTNRRLEWSIAPGSVGQFVAIQQNGWVDLLVGDFNRPRKVTNTFAIGSTSRNYERVLRGPNPADTVLASAGQGWITITSPIEGTSHVMVVAPEVAVPCARAQVAVIDWIDAQFGYPPPAIRPAGTRQRFTTTVLRQSSTCPHAGWLVRYEILSGPPAGFAPTGASAIEVVTNEAGQASVEMVQKQPTPGTNQIRIQVIRPAEKAGPGGERVMVNCGSTLSTWTAAGLSVRRSGPPTAALGQTVTYHIEVLNSGDLTTKDVTASEEAPDGLVFVRGNPPPVLRGRQLVWQLGDLGPGQRKVVDVDYRAVQQGSMAACVEVSAGNLHTSQCSTTTVFAPMLDVRLSGPEQVTVGGKVTFRITVTTRSQVPAVRLLLKDRFGEELQHADIPKSPIERDFGDLGPGQSRFVDVTFRATRPGQLCHTVEILGSDGVRASSQGCVMAVEAGPSGPAASGATAPSGPARGPGPQIPSPPLTRPGAPPALTVKKTGPAEAAVGELIEFTTRITNVGEQAFSDLRLTDQFDTALVPEFASEGYRSEGNDLVWTIHGLSPGKTAKFTIRSRCTRPVAQACNRVIVTTAAGERVEDHVCLVIRNAAPPKPPAARETPAGKLTVSVADLQNPVTAGSEVTYLVRVTNDGRAAEKQIVLTAILPAGTTVDRMMTGAEGKAIPQYDKTGTVWFTPVAELAPGETLIYRVRVQTREAGHIRMHVEATSRDHPRPIVAEKTTEVFTARE